MPDPYRILGVAHTATQEEIRSAYHRLARRYHPDLNPEPGAEARMRALNWAYEVLSDPRRRAAYDAPGWTPPPQPPPSTGYAPPTPASSGRISHQPGLAWSTLFLITMMVRALTGLINTFEPNPTAPAMEILIPTLYASGVQSEVTNAGCVDITHGEVLSYPPADCYLGIMRHLADQQETAWPIELVIAGQPYELHVWLGPGVDIPEGLGEGDCVKVQGRITGLVDGKPELRITESGQLHACP
jgi:hypothetical protein